MEPTTALDDGEAAAPTTVEDGDTTVPDQLLSCVNLARWPDPESAAAVKCVEAAG